MNKFKFAVLDVFFISGIGIVASGRVESGVIHIGDTVEIHKYNSDMKFKSKVIGIDRFKNHCDKAEANGQYCLHLQDMTKDMVWKGDTIVSA